MNESSQEELLLNMGSAKDEHGVRERFAKEDILFAKNGRLRIREFRSFPMYVICIYTIQIRASKFTAASGEQGPPDPPRDEPEPLA